MRRFARIREGKKEEGIVGGCRECRRERNRENSPIVELDLVIFDFRNIRGEGGGGGAASAFPSTGIIITERDIRNVRLL